MGREENDDRSVSARGEFVRRLSTRAEVVAVDFTRDGFHTVFVEVGPDADDGWRRAAERLGYTVEYPGTAVYRRWRVDEWWVGSPGAVRILRADADHPPSAP